MMTIFNFIGNMFGYILWFAFFILKNYGLSIIFFTIVIKLVILPFSIKQQRGMAANQRLMAKQQEIQKKYANNKQKANEEIQALYMKEGASPMAGCLPSIVPFFVMLGVYYSVINPLQNTLHIAKDKIAQAIDVLTKLPGVGGSFNSYYGQIYIVQNFNDLNDRGLLTMFSSDEIGKIADFSKGFNFLGLDLLATPKGSAFSSMLWLIPVLCLLSYWGSMFFTQKMQGNGASMQGCMKVMFLAMPIFSAWISYTVPAAVGFYWIASSVIGFIQTALLQKFYNTSIIEARSNGAHLALMKKEESYIYEITAPIKKKK